MQLGEILRQSRRTAHIPARKGACHERRLVGRDPPPGRDRQALRPGHFATTPLLAAHGGRGARVGPAPRAQVAHRASLLDPYKAKINALLAKYPELSAVRIREEIARGPDGYTGSTILIRRYLRTIRPARGRVYQEVHYEPAQAMQVDWGECGRVQVGDHDPQGLGVRGRALLQPVDVHRVHAVAAQGRVLPRPGARPGVLRRQSPRPDLRQLEGGRAQRLGPRRLFPSRVPGLVRHFCLQPIACERRDPESKGIVEGGVRYVKHNALAGRGEELTRFEDYLALAPLWRDQVANVRMHETTRERPIDRFQRERSLLRPLPAIPFDTDEVVPAVVSSPCADRVRRQPLFDTAAVRCAGPSRFAPAVTRSACCTRARWWPSMSAATSADS